MVIFFRILAGVLALTAAFLWWRVDNSDWAFAAGVLAAAAYFLTLRFQMKAQIDEAHAKRAEAVHISDNTGDRSPPAPANEQ